MVRAEAEIHKAYIVQARYRLIETFTFSERWTVFMESMYRYILLDSIVAQYLDKDITKQDLTKQFLSRENATERERFLQDIISIENLLQRYEDQVHLISMFMCGGYSQLRLPLPVIIINDTSVQRLQLVQKAKTVNYLNNYTKLYEICFFMKHLIVSGPIEQINRIVMDPLSNIRDKLKMVEAILTEYQDSIKMDAQFYL